MAERIFDGTGLRGVTLRDQPAVLVTSMRLRQLTSSGFDMARQGVVLSGLADHHKVTVIVKRAALGSAFPEVASSLLCVAFVERNLIALRDIVNGKLRTGGISPPGAGSWAEDVLVEVTAADILRSRRWLNP